MNAYGMDNGSGMTVLVMRASSAPLASAICRLYRSPTRDAGLPLELTFLTALMIGLLGSTHCIGMCGGIVGAINVVPPPAREGARLGRIAHHLTYNAGRILSYTLAGAAAGLIGAQTTKISPDAAVPVGSVVAGLFMVALGLYIAGWWRAIAGLERAGGHVWRYIEPAGRRLLPPKTPCHVFGLGLVWGWLPCGLVYSALALALVTASPRHGAWLMFGFGLGTLPMLLAMGNLAGHLRKLVRYPVVRRITGTVIILFGVYTCVTALSGHGHHGHHSSTGIDTSAAPLTANADQTAAWTRFGSLFDPPWVARPAL